MKVPNLLEYWIGAHLGLRKDKEALWVDDTFLEEEESQMAFVEKKLSTEIRRLNDELREASRKISL